jgi:Flp pilus assembly protein TadD
VGEGHRLEREGKHDLAVADLTEAVAREDKLRYDEPPDWIQPVRHALGAVLLELGRAPEAESVYREDLKRAPGNVWALHGLAESQRLQKKDADAKATDAQLRVAMKKADVKLTSSCMCLPSAALCRESA